MRACLFWERMESHPPVLLRLLARVPRGRPLEPTEIAERGGLSVMQVEAISQQTDWRGIDLPTARAFMVGCGCDLSDRVDYHRIRQYLKDNARARSRLSKFRHLRESKNWETVYLPLLERFANHIKQCRGARPQV